MIFNSPFTVPLTPASALIFCTLWLKDSPFTAGLLYSLNHAFVLLTNSFCFGFVILVL
ncbi:MAG: hypothetical protein E6069_03620 [Clostridium perfringens]|nr:hypothetical protein [Clostridium perfringens]